MANNCIYNNILVTGCGGDIGLGICKILKSAKISKKIIGCDMHNNHPGKLFFDDIELIGRADDKNYLSQLKRIIKKYSIDVIIPTSEAELRFLHNNKINVIDNTSIISANSEAMSVGFDKLLTIEFLKKHGLPFPWTKRVTDGLPDEYPCIIKKRNSSGSKDIAVINKDNINLFKNNESDYIFQELLLPDDEEYTCGLYGTQGNEIRIIVFKRQLAGGNTSKGEVVYNEKINSLLLELANRLNLKGSINVQLRFSHNQPVIFEINPRFSSTVVFRHLLGFQDLLWSLLEKVDLKLDDYDMPNPGIKFFRLSDEVIIV